MTPEQLAALMDGPTPGEQEAQPPAAPVEQGAPAPLAPETPLPITPETVLGDPRAPADTAARYDASGRVGAAIVTGAAKSIYETKDFIFGKPEAADKSALRQSVENLDKELGEQSVGYSFVSGLSQFATGMLGAGKLVSAAKVVPAVRGAVGAAEASRVGGALLSSGKAAAVGAVAFDPSGARLSDMVQGTFLANPVSGFLASQPGDSAALGRAKNALESIGVDAALAGVFGATLAGFKALRSGDQAAIVATQAEMQHAIAHKDAKLAVAKGDAETVERIAQDHPVAVAQAEASLPAGAESEQATKEAGDWARFLRDRLQGEERGVSPPDLGDAAPRPAIATANGLSLQPLGPPRELRPGDVENFRFAKNGEELGTITIEPRGDTAYIQGIYTDYVGGGPGMVGTRDLLQVMRAYAEAHPDIQYLAGDRVTGARKYGTVGADGEMRAKIPRRQSTAIATKPDGTAEAVLPEVSVGPHTEPPVQGKDVVSQAASAEAQQAQPTVQRVDSPTQGAGPDGLPRPSQPLAITQEQLDSFIAHGQADTAQILGPGGWQGAIDRGYRFGDGGSIPWQKFARAGTEAEGGLNPLDFMIARMADELAAPLAKLKGGDAQGVMSDAQVERMVAQRANLWNEDPQALMGELAQAGKNARTMSVNMEAAFLVGQRVMQDTLNLRSRIQLGMLEEFGGDFKAARAALEDHLQVAATVFGQAQAMRASAGRALRRNRLDFQMSLEDVAAMKGMSDAQLMTTLDSVGHDFAVASKLVKPGFWARAKDDLSYLFINNLLWGLRTHFVNLSTNSYMLMGRPAERALGFAIRGDMHEAGLQAQQYAYMSSSIHDAFRDAVRTWKTGDSILAPHSVETNAAGIAGDRGTNWVAEGYKPWDSVPNILANAYTGFMKGAGLPTRALGAVDELMKQTVYRSKVMAAAHGEGVAAGLEGQALTDHVRKTLLDSFDDAGRAVDVRALDEANIATFQQDLLPGTMGSTAQAAVANHPMLRFVLPFVKTPTNVLRMGWKLTPGLNMLQTEYRQMIRGEMGAEKQAQAMGQFAMGSLFLGSAALLAHEGRITGGGPQDKNLMAQLRATGWQPYSFVTTNPDGSRTYTNYGRYDPVAMPFGMVADIIDIVERDQDGDGHAERAWNAASGVLIALAKQMGQKSYLTSLHDTLDAVMEPERNVQKMAGATVANFVPFSSGLRFVNPDPNLRETRGVIDKIMSVVPGLSPTLPPKRDVFGDPLTVHKGLWVDGEKTAVDAEVRRMIDEAGQAPMGPPSTTVGGVDLRDVAMKDGRNAYDFYQEMAGHPPRGPSMKETVAKIMRTSAYQNAPDGDPATKGTKSAMLAGTVSKYREAALKRLKGDENVRTALAARDIQARAAYAATRGPKSNAQAGAPAIAQIGRAFGVDLSGALPNP